MTPELRAGPSGPVTEGGGSGNNVRTGPDLGNGVNSVSPLTFNRQILPIATLVAPASANLEVTGPPALYTGYLFEREDATAHAFTLTNMGPLGGSIVIPGGDTRACWCVWDGANWTFGPIYLIDV